MGAKQSPSSPRSARGKLRFSRAPSSENTATLGSHRKVRQGSPRDPGRGAGHARHPFGFYTSGNSILMTFRVIKPAGTSILAISPTFFPSKPLPIGLVTRILPVL